MAWKIEKQANGRYAGFSTRLKDYVVIDASAEEIERIYADKGVKVYLASARAQMAKDVSVSADGEALIEGSRKRARRRKSRPDRSERPDFPTMIDVDAYLARIGYEGSREPSHETLRELHLRHLLTVPFENLDIHWKRPIVVDVDRFLRKIIGERRGGFCYELNGAFAALLRELRFEVTMLSARVISADGTFGPEFDHMTLLVNGEWIADVGFGESSLVPLNLDGTPEGNYRVTNGEYQVLRDGEWCTDYLFTMTPRELHEFGPMCDYQQTSPQSPFTKKKVITLARDDGRITLTADKLIVTKDDAREETAVEDWEKALFETFAIRPVAASG